MHQFAYNRFHFTKYITYKNNNEYPYTQVSVRLFGYNFQDSSKFRIVWSPRQKGEECDNLPFSTTVQVHTLHTVT